MTQNLKPRQWAEVRCGGGAVLAAKLLANPAFVLKSFAGHCSDLFGLLRCSC